MNQDDYDVASLAAMTNGRINQINSKFGREAPVPKVDIRRIIQGGGGNMHPQHYPQQPYYPQPQQGYYPQPPAPNINGAVNEYGLPESVPANMTQLPLVIRDRDGNIIDLNQAPSAAGANPQYAPPQGNDHYQGFIVPEYGAQNNQPISSRGKNQPSAPENIFDIILKEIKGLKKSVNKLIREFESSKLPSQKPTQTKKIDDTDSQPSDISNGIYITPLGGE